MDLSQRTSKASVLLAEDNPDVRTMFLLLLENAGFAVSAHPDGGAAIMNVTQSKPDIIITDIMMPEVDGIELIKYVRSSPDLANIPIIAFSAFSSGQLKLAEEAGANATLRKPVDFDNLVRKIVELLPNQQATV